MKVTELRQQAEERLRTTNRDIAAMTTRDVQQLVHELQVLQIELEIQNEALRRSQMELEAARDRYVDLYDFSPAGHLMLDRDGTIVEANLRAGMLLGLNRKELIEQPLARFIVSEDQDRWHRHVQEVLKTGTRQTCELRLRKKTGASYCLYLESLAVHEEPGRITHWRTSILDISDRKGAEQELDTERAQLGAIIGSAMDAIITVDEQERVRLFNQAAESMFGCRAAEVIGQPLDRFIPERYRQAHHGHMSAFAKEAQPSFRGARRADNLYALRANGEEFPFEAAISHVVVGSRKLFTVILRDVTERKRAEDALRSSDAFTLGILNSLAAHICVLNKSGIIIKTNDAWKKFARGNSDNAAIAVDVGKNYLEVCRQAIAAGQPTVGTTLDGIEAVMEGRESSFIQEYPCHSPEEQRWFQMRVTPLKGAEGVVIAHTDISERVRMGLALEQHVRLVDEKRAELESLTGKLIQAQEQERKRIARELHDDFNQRVAALTVELETLERIAGRDFPEQIVKQLAGIRARAAELSDDLHDMAYRLHPSLLDHVGLDVAMRDHVAEFTRRTGVPVTFTARAVPTALPPDVKTNLFRVMQESLQNVFKHAQASEVTVRLSGSSKGIGVSVRDNGKGFDLENKGARTKGIGLTSMQERARLLGGFLRIHSLPTEGTKVCAWVPRSQEGG